MSLDITPLTPKGRMVIKAYGDGGFFINGEQVTGSVILFPQRILPWSVKEASEITAASLQPLVEAVENVELCIVGCGPTFVPPPKELRKAMRDKGVVLEWMDSGAACRTHGIMLMEEREVAAAIIAID